MFDAQTLQSRVIKIGTVTQTNIKKLKETIEIPLISVADLRKGMEEKKIELIDVRTQPERDEFNIGGKHIPMAELYAWFETADKNIKTVLYCASGKRSGEAAKTIKDKFPDANVFSLEGGCQNHDL